MGVGRMALEGRQLVGGRDAVLFHLPGVVNGAICGRRVAKLYGAGRYFLCRDCYPAAQRALGVRGFAAGTRRIARDLAHASPRSGVR